MSDGKVHALPRGGVRALLSSLEAKGNHLVPKDATGRIEFRMDPGSESSPEASIWFKDGLIYSATLSSFTPPMALRVRSAGCLSDDEYRQVAPMEATAIGPYVIATYRVSPSLIEELNRELLLAVVSHLYDWHDASWRYIPKETTEAFTTSGMEPSLVVSAVDERIGQWRAVTRHHPQAVQPTTVPQAGPGWAAKAGGEVTPAMASLLSHVDGKRTIAKIASACGFTRFEITRLLAQAASDQILVFPGAAQRDARDTDLGQALVDEERRARGGRAVTSDDIRAAEQRVAEARLALAMAESELEALRQQVG